MEELTIQNLITKFQSYINDIFKNDKSVTTKIIKADLLDDKIVCELAKTIDGGELEDYTSTEIEPWEEYDEDGHYGGIELYYNREVLMEKIADMLTDNFLVKGDETDESDDDFLYTTHIEYTEMDDDDNLSVENYVNIPPSYMDPGDYSYNIEGSVTVYVAYEFELNKKKHKKQGEIK